MKLKFNISLWALFSTYVIANGLLYSWAFWSTFKINVLQYVSIYDLLASIIFLVASPLAIFICYSILVRIGFSSSVSAIAPAMRTKPRKLISLALDIATILFYYFIAISAYIESTGYRKIIISFLILLPVMIILINNTTTILKDKLPFNNVVLSIAIITPLFLFMNAKSQADDILNGRDTFIIQSDSPCLSGETYRYISTVGDKAFAISLKDNSLCVFKYNFVKLFEEKTSTVVSAIPSNLT